MSERYPHRQWLFNPLSSIKFGVEGIFDFALWILLFMMQITRSYYDYVIGITEKFEWNRVLDDWLGLLPFVLLFCIYKWYLEPRFFFKQKYRIYILSAILTSLVVMLFFTIMTADHVPVRVQDYLEKSQADSHYLSELNFKADPIGFLMRSQFFSFFMMSFIVMGISLGVSVVFRSHKEIEKRKEVEAEKVKTELDYLKYQINPHFFMNTLNNIHALVDIDKETAKDAIIELARLMRYMLYETSMQKVPLHKELEFQHHFIDLMRLRFDDSVSIIFDELPANSPCLNAQVPPLIGIVFIENAFKYGISHRYPSFITVKYSYGDDNRFHMHCKNSNFSKEIISEKSGGLGLENVRKRLHLLYGDKYTLNISQTDTDYSVDLFIPISLS